MSPTSGWFMSKHFWPSSWILLAIQLGKDMAGSENFSILKGHIKQNSHQYICCGLYLGLSPFPVIVTTRNISFLVGDSGFQTKPSLATITGKGDNPTCTVQEEEPSVDDTSDLLCIAGLSLQLVSNSYHGQVWEKRRKMAELARGCFWVWSWQKRSKQKGRRFQRCKIFFLC